MNENTLVNDSGLSEYGETDGGNLASGSGDSQDTLESDIDTVSGGDSVPSGNADILGLYDVELGGVPVVIVGDATAELDIMPLAETGSIGYQVSDYWLNYFRGVLQKLGDVDYCLFSTREYSGGSGSNYTQHYYMYYAEDMGEDTIQSGTYTCIDAYATNNIYYVDTYQSYLGNVETGRLIYSNIGSHSDAREGVSHADSWALLFFLGFFAVYTVCHDIFDYVMERVYRK